MRILVFAKAPVPGHAKTRLIPELGPKGAARLQGRLVHRALEAAAALGHTELWCAEGTRHPFFEECQRIHGCILRPQPPGHLGQRMRHAFAAGAFPALLLGSDAPGLDAARLREAAGALQDGGDGVVVPALDGGYVLIGLNRPAVLLFEGIRWGSATVLEETRRHAVQAGLRITELVPCPDIDRPEDLVHCSPDLLQGLTHKNISEL